jgi:hypothetical protein
VEQVRARTEAIQDMAAMPLIAVKPAIPVQAVTMVMAAMQATTGIQGTPIIPTRKAANAAFAVWTRYTARTVCTKAYFRARNTAVATAAILGTATMRAPRSIHPYARATTNFISRSLVY